MSMSDAKVVPIVLFCNNQVGYWTLRWLLENQYNLVGVVMHTASDAYFYDKIQGLLVTTNTYYIEYDNDHQKLSDFLDNIETHVGLSAYFGYILAPAHIQAFSAGIVNIHGGFLPHCKGKNPNAWAIMDEVKAGVTLHQIDEKIDEGKLIAQAEIQVLPDMTAKDLYLLLETASFDLITSEFPNYICGESELTDFDDVEGSYHAGKDLSDLKCLDLDAPTTARKVLKQLKAATFPPFPGPYFIEDGTEYRISIAIDRVLK
jgi:methionyl-tRNA formyltransferase